MSVTFKDIEDYSQRLSLTGSEKIPVSDLEFVTTKQIAEQEVLVANHNDCDFAISDGSAYDVVRFVNGHIVTKNFDSATISTLLNDIETLLAAL